MARKAIIFDLDNTIYPVSSIAGELFRTLFHLLESSGELAHDLEQVKQDLMRKPFQVVASHYGFSDALTHKGRALLANLRYDGPIAAFEDYSETKALPVEKFLVTSGFPSLQRSKIEGMGIENDFREIHIVDVETGTKKEVFAAILQRHGYAASDVVVVGDDPASEIKAAEELGLAAVLYDKLNLHPDFSPRITHFRELYAFVR
jgi:putative hydrolase of the HAD superfamily